jgi:hypothetical protein
MNQLLFQEDSTKEESGDTANRLIGENFAFD